MNFDFNAEQYMFADSVRAYLDRGWSTTRLREAMDGDGMAPDLWTGLVELGLLALAVPEEHGGLGLGFVDLALALEELGRALVPGPAVETILCADALARFGTPAQRAALMPQIAAGALRVVPALVEEHGFAPFDPVSTTATAQPGGWRIDGRKILTPYAAHADFLLVAVRFEATGELGLVLVEPGRPGIGIAPEGLIDPGSRADSVVLSGVEISPSDVLGGSPSPLALARLADAGAMTAAMQMAGIAGRMLELTVAYTGQREQFGRPIGSMQAIKHRAADMMVAVETARTAGYFAAWALASDAPEAGRAASMAKAYCGDAARFVCNEAIQLHGGIGFTWDLDLHLYLRRAKALEYAYGDASLHRERVIAFALAEREAA